MKKPEGYEEATAITGDFTPLPAGAYVCAIKEAQEKASKSGRNMLELKLDIAEGPFTGHFESLAKTLATDASWPCVYRQLSDGPSVPHFKGLITAIEESNAGFRWNFNESELLGKSLGMVFRREQYTKRDGSIAWITCPCGARSASAVRAGKCPVPDDKPLLVKLSKPSWDPGQVGTTFGVDESDLPF
ncbi:MAG: DUF669 domain-containing protein [Clostridiales bacterium]|jgi:hypothetical protein|nr:DUF669 domain-containing protein [Clostridiales bacterium]